jgi:hypothetical protein
MPKLITSQTLTSSTTSVSFNSIPATYQDLLIVASIKCDESSFTNEQIRIRFNGLSTSIYSNTSLRGDGSSVTTSRASSETSGFVGLMNTNEGVLAQYSSTTIYIPSYLSTSVKQTGTFTAHEMNGTTAYTTALANLAQVSAAITSITFTTANGRNFVSGASFFLYGISNS